MPVTTLSSKHRNDDGSQKLGPDQPCFHADSLIYYVQGRNMIFVHHEFLFCFTFFHEHVPHIHPLLICITASVV